MTKCKHTNHFWWSLVYCQVSHVSSRRVVWHEVRRSRTDGLLLTLGQTQASPVRVCGRDGGRASSVQHQRPPAAHRDLCWIWGSSPQRCQSLQGVLWLLRAIVSLLLHAAPEYFRKCLKKHFISLSCSACTYIPKPLNPVVILILTRTFCTVTVTVL